MPISYLMTLTRKQFMAISMPKSKVPSAGTSRRPCFSAWREGDGSPACVVVPGSRQPPPVPGKPLVSERGFQPEDPDPPVPEDLETLPACRWEAPACPCVRCSGGKSRGTRLVQPTLGCRFGPEPPSSKTFVLKNCVAGAFRHIH